jgi:hypothetical protein
MHPVPIPDRLALRAIEEGTGHRPPTPPPDPMKIPRLLLLLVAILAAVALNSCTGFIAGVTGQPIPVEPVTTKDGSTFNVASADLLRAKVSPPDTAWGLYDAGLVARRAAEVIDSGK